MYIMNRIKRIMLLNSKSSKALILFNNFAIKALRAMQIPEPKIRKANLNLSHNVCGYFVVPFISIIYAS